MSSYHHSTYEQTFARLLNKSLQKGGNDPEKALRWLNRPLRFIFALLRSSHRLETTDAFLDVREHLKKRIHILADSNLPEK